MGGSKIMAKYLFLVCLTLLSISTLSSARWAGGSPPKCVPSGCNDNEVEICQAASQFEAQDECGVPECANNFGNIPCASGYRTCCLPADG
ncbi:uncharacterized protein BYT42DRAFT_174890 [Radiomyces spectabilis]|uniref:uncharacterized protein n=1 Tax=Radiomyces spectabilis TaxID=64574 RepID=UPI00221F8C6C|nr:uncharacterized protein BYT42DRAFT_174890 [Radiomyces spectabilis]KAI8390931.1 hypothetical protein BYT42DRAFT_174890 [Radiomyces spectabilis]